jgi:hypothetical protein
VLPPELESLSAEVVGAAVDASVAAPVAWVTKVVGLAAPLLPGLKVEVLMGMMVMG